MLTKHETKMIAEYVTSKYYIDHNGIHGWKRDDVIATVQDYGGLYEDSYAVMAKAMDIHIKHMKRSERNGLFWELIFLFLPQ